MVVCLQVKVNHFSFLVSSFSFSWNHFFWSVLCNNNNFLSVLCNNNNFLEVLATSCEEKQYLLAEIVAWRLISRSVFSDFFAAAGTVFNLYRNHWVLICPPRLMIMAVSTVFYQSGHLTVIWFLSKLFNCNHYLCKNNYYLLSNECSSVKEIWRDMKS